MASITETQGLLLPQSLEAEQAVLGCMLLDPIARDKAIEILKGEDFYHPAHLRIFQAVTALSEESMVADYITVQEKLKQKNELEQVGGLSYLIQLCETTPTTAHVEHYAQTVKEKALLRHIIHWADGLKKEAMESEGKVEEFLDEAERTLFQLAESKTYTSVYLMKDLIHDSFKTVEELYKRKNRVTGIATGFYTLDEKLSGLQPSDLIIVAGRPSMGKTSLALSFAMHCALKDKVPVAIFSLEMSKEQLVLRMLASEARTDFQRVRTGFLREEDWPNLTTAAGRLSEALLFIDDSPMITVMELRAKARRLRAEQKLGLVIVDYLQLMHSSWRYDSRIQEITEISRSLKGLARELRIPVVALSQLSRAPEQTHDNRPKLSHLRESGALEQDADVVLMLFREEYYAPSEENEGLAEVIIAKQRNGPTGTVLLIFKKEYARFESMDTHSMAPVAD